MALIKQLINRLPATRNKLFLARLLYHLVHLVCRRDVRTVVRRGIKYQLDLTEGIDLSVFLFGSFQKHITQGKYLSLPGNAVIFDVGANAGILTLQFAKLVPSGRVYAFEPTFYAFSKLKRNMELNPQLAERIVAVQSFVSSTSSKELHIRAYASWKVAGRAKEEKHRVHQGIEKSAEKIPAVSLDDFCKLHEIERLDLIKIDTDGHEPEVLKGAKTTIERFAPAVIFEVGAYLMEEAGIDFSDYFDFFDLFGYRFFDSKSGSEINKANYQRHIPLSSTIDILALPAAKTDASNDKEQGRL